MQSATAAFTLERRFQSTFRVGDRVLRLESNDETIDEYWRRCYRRLAVGCAEPAGIGRDEGIILWDGDAVELWFNGSLEGRRSFGEALDAAVWGSAKLLGMSLRRLQRQRAFYASGAALGDVCLAIAAPSGTGKTTLALELLRRSWATYGDEFLLLDRKTLVVEGVPLAFMLRGQGRAGTQYDFDVEETFGRAAIAAPRALTHLVLLTRSDDGVSSLETISPAAATLELLPHLFVECLRIADIWEAVERFERVACYRLRATDQRAAADLLEDLVSARACS